MKNIKTCANCEKEFNANNAFSTLNRFGKELYFCSEKCTNEFLGVKK